MSVATLENDIVMRARAITGDESLTRRRLVAWCTGRKDNPTVDPMEGDITVWIEPLLVWALFEPPKSKKVSKPTVSDEVAGF